MQEKITKNPIDKSHTNENCHIVIILFLKCLLILNNLFKIFPSPDSQAAD